MSDFSAAWLALREPADAAGRSEALARRFAAALPRPCRLLDLGAGTGATARALAPALGGDQLWHLAERDPALLAAAGDRLASWAQSAGFRALPTAAGVTVEAGAAQWEFRLLSCDLAAAPTALPALPLDGVVASAFFDLVSAAWLEDFADALASRGLPLLAALTVDGRRIWEPAAPEDAETSEAFRRDQRRDKGFGPALGGEAPTRLAQRLEAAGYGVSLAASDWRLGGASRELLRQLVHGEAAAARAARPDAAAAIAAWERRRRAQAAAGALAATIGHLDLLALPPPS